jgi:hypothetical protein
MPSKNEDKVCRTVFIILGNNAYKSCERKTAGQNE